MLFLQPDASGFPVGQIGQPFYGWCGMQVMTSQPVLTGFLQLALAGLQSSG
jgi:hypothetical protein